MSDKNDQMYVGYSNDVWVELLASDPHHLVKYEGVTETQTTGNPVIVRKSEKSDTQIFKMIGPNKVLVQRNTPRYIESNGKLEAKGSMILSIKSKIKQFFIFPVFNSNDC